MPKIQAKAVSKYDSLKLYEKRNIITPIPVINIYSTFILLSHSNNHLFSFNICGKLHFYLSIFKNNSGPAEI